MNAGDTAWVMVSAALVLFMTVGLAFFYGGLEPRRNVLNMVAMNVFTIAIVTITWVAAGFSLAFGLGGRDFAGGAVVHLSAGVAAAVLVLLLRPRTEPDAAAYQPSSVPVVVLGAGILWFGWFGFNAGSALGANQVAANAFTVTQIAAAAGFLVWAVLEYSRTGKTTLTGLSTGAIAGLATIGLRATGEQEDLGLNAMFVGTGSAAPSPGRPPLSPALAPLRRE